MPARKLSALSPSSPFAANLVANAKDTRPCSVCGGGDDEGTILLCDECNKPYHNGIHCAGFVTECDYGDWACLNCSEQQSDEDEEGASQDEEAASVAAGA